MQFATARDLERVLVLGLLHLDGDIALRLAHQAVADQAARHLVPFPARQRRVVDRERHGEGRGVDGLGRQRRLHLRRADRMGDGGLAQARDGDNVACRRFLQRFPGKTAERQQLRDAAAFDHVAVPVERAHWHIRPRPSALDAPGQQAPQIGVALHRDRQHGERRVRLHRRRGHVLDDLVEQGVHIAGPGVRLLRRPALFGGREQGREVQLRLVRIQRGEQVEGLVLHLERALFGLVHLVDQHDRVEPQPQRLPHHELRLRHRPFARIHQHDDAVDHGQNTLHLAAEIGVAGGVDDVDARALPDNAGAFRQDGDAAFTLLVVRVHGALGHLLVGAEGAGLVQQAVNQRGFAVIDMRDNRDIADIHSVELSPITGGGRPYPLGEPGGGC